MGYLNNNTAHDVRAAFNPTGNAAVGIVPINDLTTYSKVNGEPRTFTDTMSFEHNSYDSRSASNYNPRGRRQGAFVVEEPRAAPVVQRVSRPPTTQGESVWSAMHPGEKAFEAQDLRKTSSGLRKVGFHFSSKILYPNIDYTLYIV